MQYRIDIFGLTTAGLPVTSLFSPDITVQRWSFRINAPGVMAFSIKATHPKATEDNLRLYRRVKLYVRNLDEPGYVDEWIGYIEATNQLDDRIEVVCAGLLKILRKRFPATDHVFSGEGSEEAFDMLETTNGGDGDTGISEGEGGVTTTRDLQLQGDVDILKGLEILAQAHDGAEYQVNTDAELDFVPSLGSDKSGTIHLIFHRSKKPGTNVAEIEIGEAGEDMATQVEGKTSGGGGLTSTRPSSPSDQQDDYGVLVERRQFNEAQDQSALDSMTESLVSQLQNPITDFRIAPLRAAKRLDITTGTRMISGLQHGDVAIGDLITVTIITENRSITEVKRIAEITYEVDENGSERMLFTLSKAGVFITAGYLDATQIDQLTRRVKQIESVLD